MLKTFVASLNEVGGVQTPSYFDRKQIELKEAFLRPFEDASQSGILLPVLLQEGF